jgi:hypothetical protein
MAFEGIRLAREHPKAILLWAALIFVVTLVGAAILIGIAGEAMTELTEMQGQREPDPQEMMRVMGAVVPALLVFLPLTLILYGVLYAAVNRAVLRPEEARRAPLKLGGAELRQALVLLLLMLVLLFAWVVLTVVVALIAAAVGGERGADGGAGGAAGLVAFVGIGLSLVLMVFLGVRLSLASPLTFGEGRVRVLQSWHLTRGKFWPLFGGYALAVALAVVIYLLALVVFVAVAAVTGGGLDAIGKIFSPDMSSFGAYFTLGTIANTAFSSLLSALTIAITVGAAAEAYRQITNAGPAAPAAETVAGPSA